jgi:hypothetical protein
VNHVKIIKCLSRNECIVKLMTAGFCSIMMAVKNVCLDISAVAKEALAQAATSAATKKKTKSGDASEALPVLAKATRPSSTQVVFTRRFHAYLFLQCGVCCWDDVNAGCDC